MSLYNTVQIEGVVTTQEVKSAWSTLYGCPLMVNSRDSLQPQVTLAHNVMSYSNSSVNIRARNRGRRGGEN